MAAECELSAVRRRDDGVRELRAGVALVAREHDATARVGAELLHLAIVEQKEYGRHVGRLQGIQHGLSNILCGRFPRSKSQSNERNEGKFES